MLVHLVHLAANLLALQDIWSSQNIRKTFGRCQNVLDIWSCPKQFGMDQTCSWTFWIGPNFKDHLAWTKCLFLVFFNLFILFIYFWLRWVFVAARGLSLVVASRGYSLLQCACFSLQWLLLLQSKGSRCVGFSSCGTRAQ